MAQVGGLADRFADHRLSGLDRFVDRLAQRQRGGDRGAEGAARAVQVGRGAPFTGNFVRVAAVEVDVDRFAFVVVGGG